MVVAHVQAHAGQRLEEIAKALRCPTKILKGPVAKLVSSGALRTEGRKRGTKYFVGGGKPVAARPRGRARRKKA